MIEAADDTYIMPFGKHKGVSLGAVPASYLMWCWNQKGMENVYPELLLYIKEHHGALLKEAREEEHYDADSWEQDHWRED